MVNWDATAHEKLLFAILDVADIKLSGATLDKVNEKMECTGTAIPQHLSKLRKKFATGKPANSSASGSPAPGTKPNAKGSRGAKKSASVVPHDDDEDGVGAGAGAGSGAEEVEVPAKKKRARAAPKKKVVKNGGEEEREGKRVKVEDAPEGEEVAA